MEKRVIVIGHGSRELMETRKGSWEVFAHLNELGKRQARKFAVDYHGMLIGCRIFATSPLICAQETLAEIVDEMVLPKDFLDNVMISQEFWTFSPRDYLSNDPLATAQSLALRDMTFAMAQGLRFFRNGMNYILNAMSEINGYTALCVSHPGPTDFLFAWARHTCGNTEAFNEIEDLGPCEGMVLSFHQSRLIGFREIRSSPPAGAK